ncbi:MAG: arsenosugar biosynthesis radical SAM protein ArsS [Deltaproteobacteria bacterium]|nr:MAG: arsenosugar biosynthesis radical SAM protein ArsS [Deltaproteobacteria bacterium]
MPSNRLAQLNDEAMEQGSLTVEPFRENLFRHGLTLKRDRTTTLQINVGLLCNQTCRHCHLAAGPNRKEIMDLDTARAVVSYAGRSQFETIDITGGAPELNPNLATLIKRLSPIAPRILLRSNLSALNENSKTYLIDLLKEHRVVVVGSLPSLNESQTDSQRGKDIFRTSIDTLQRLNALGYGQDGTDLELDLVSNPTGAFLPPPQPQTEARFRKVLEQKWDIRFNNLFSFANVPLGRFLAWLQQSGNFEQYMQRLASSFNPCAVEGVMCRTLVSVSWEGYFYDCDFNLANGLLMGGRKITVSEMSGSPECGSSIAVGDHCYACTAGLGFT